MGKSRRGITVSNEHWGQLRVMALSECKSVGDFIVDRIFNESKPIIESGNVSIACTKKVENSKKKLTPQERIAIYKQGGDI